MNPIATARLQLHAGFTLDDATAQVPYYAALGVSHFYLSPISAARPGSTHGYDVIAHGCINPELGGEPAFRRLIAALRQRGMGAILDIVPNHMASHADNPWWWDVLAQGEVSPYASWLDIAWDSPAAGLRGKVLAPFLGEPYALALDKGAIRLAHDQSRGGYYISVHDNPYPLAAGSLPLEGPSPDIVLAQYNAATQQSRALLHELLERQHYRLAWWRCAADIINWRRFFEVSELIGVRVESEPVFDAVHELYLRLYSEGLIDGLRIDHVDGLACPLGYCRKLYAALQQRRAKRPHGLDADPPWLLVEKILAVDEVLDERWQVDGSSGYDFMDQVGAFLHDAQGEAPLDQHWAALAPDSLSVTEHVQQARALMLQRHFVAERSALLRCLEALATALPATRDLTPAAIAQALDAFLVHFPVYRTYADTQGRHATDRVYVSRALEAAKQDMQSMHNLAGHTVLDALDAWLGGDLPPSWNTKASPGYTQLRMRAIQRFQQLTPPLAAKSLEDTTFYRYGRMLSRNEVGSDPHVFSLSIAGFHKHAQWRAVHAPRAMLATATHDHKRGEDVRARLAVLSELPERWAALSQQWLKRARGWVDSARGQGDERYALDPQQAAERYMLYQTVVGAWPLDLSLEDSAAMQAFAQRIVAWQTKALREGKTSSGWFEPQQAYEEASASFVLDLLAGKDKQTLDEMANFVRQIAAAGAVNSFTQTVLRHTVPGVPDLYQGTEFWDFSLVDPDNRRPVDFATRATALASAPANLNALLPSWRNGHVKQGLVAACLHLRQSMPALFARGHYQPLEVQGPRKDHLLAFSRNHEDQAVIIVVPRCIAAAFDVAADTTEKAHLPMVEADFWQDTHIVLPAAMAARHWHQVFTPYALQARNATLAASQILADFPVAILR